MKKARDMIAEKYREPVAKILMGIVDYINKEDQNLKDAVRSENDRDRKLHQMMAGLYGSSAVKSFDDLVEFFKWEERQECQVEIDDLNKQREYLIDLARSPRMFDVNKEDMYWIGTEDQWVYVVPDHVVGRIRAMWFNKEEIGEAVSVFYSIDEGATSNFVILETEYDDPSSLKELLEKRFWEEVESELSDYEELSEGCVLDNKESPSTERLSHVDQPETIEEFEEMCEFYISQVIKFDQSDVAKKPFGEWGFDFFTHWVCLGYFRYCPKSKGWEGEIKEYFTDACNWGSLKNMLDSNFPNVDIVEFKKVTD